eukprot:756957-Rhodomonas_salina.1
MLHAPTGRLRALRLQWFVHEVCGVMQLCSLTDNYNLKQCPDAVVPYPQWTGLFQVVCTNQ